MAALTWAGLIEWQTIKVQVVVQVGPRRRLRGLLATRSGPIAAWPQRRFARVLASIGALAQSVRPARLAADVPTGYAEDRMAGTETRTGRIDWQRADLSGTGHPRPDLRAE